MIKYFFISLVAILTSVTPFSSAYSYSTSVVTLTNEGGRVDWSADGKRIAFDRLDDRGFYQTWAMDPNGDNAYCITCNSNLLPTENIGNPAWYPSGQFLAVEATDPSLSPNFVRRKPIYHLATNPGAGFHNNIWLVSANGAQALQVTFVGNGKPGIFKHKGGEDCGVLHPHFSHNGRQLIWAEMVSPKPSPLGSWVIKLADVYLNNGAPVVSNIRTLAPGNLGFYETHGFSPDDSKIIFTGSYRGTIYVYDWNSGYLQALTDPSQRQWNEHAHFTPDGQHVIFMSSMGIPQSWADIGNHSRAKMDFWIMNSDGSNKQRLTYFNDPASSQYIPGHVIASDLDVSPDGRRFVGFIQDNPRPDHAGSIVVVTFQ